MGERTPLSLRQLREQKLEVQPFIIGDGLLGERAIMIVGGPPKSYKSFLVSSLIRHMTTGVPLFGASRTNYVYFPIPKPVRVLLLDQEIDTYDIKLRMDLLMADMPQEQREQLLDNLYVKSCDHNMRLDSIAGRTYMAEVIHSVKPQVVILDPLIEFHDGDENSTREMSHMLHNLDWLRERLHFATVIVHHTAKLNEFNSLRSGPDLLRGSSVLHGKADTFMMIQCIRTEPVVELRAQFTLRRGRPIRRMRLRTADDESILFHFHKWEDGEDDVLVGQHGPN